MRPYFVFLVLALLLAFLAYRKNRNNRLFEFLLFAVMTLFAGLRSALVGTDTNGYATGFEELLYLNHDIGSGLSVLWNEPGFYYLQKWLGQLSNEYYVLLIGIAIVFCLFVILGIRKQSSIQVFSLFVFITLGYYTFVFNAARQGIAMAVYMMSIPFIINRDFLKYTALVLCAALFHKTIIIAIPLYFFFTMKFSSKSIMVALVGGISIGLLLPYILSFGATLEDRYLLYVEGSATGGYLLTAFYVVLALFFAYQRQFIKAESLLLYDVFLNMLLVGSTIYLVVSLSGAYVELTRFAAYFQISSIFLWPMLITDRTKPISSFLLVIAIIGHLGFFAVFLTKMAHLTPYMFNSDIISGIL